jgi:hypothetical protein
MPIDWTSLTNPREALNFVFKKDSAYDAYQKQNQFVAVALTDGMALTADQASALSQVFRDEKSQDREPGEHSSRLFFKGRILGENSPHLFLPDPCDLATSANANYAAKLITMHTTFVTTRDANFDDNQNIEQNDLFNVILGPGSADQPFNLQIGKALGRSKKSLSRTSSDAALNCGSLAALFADVRSRAIDLKMANCATGSINFEETTAAELDIVMTHPLGKAEYDVSSGVGYRGQMENTAGEVIPAGWHNGLDFSDGGGKAIYASHDGRIQYRTEETGGAGGYSAVITHSDGVYSTYYAHMDANKTQELRDSAAYAGTQDGAIKQGALVGYTGDTGEVTSAHLHWEVWRNGSPVSAPETYILFAEPCDKYDTPEK